MTTPAPDASPPESSNAPDTPPAQPHGAAPPKPGPPQGLLQQLQQSNEPGQVLLGAAKQNLRVLTIFGRRVSRSDFYNEKAMDEERAALAAARTPVTEPLAQDYAAWRRALLWPAAVLLLVAAVFACIDYVLMWGGEETDVLREQGALPTDFIDDLDLVNRWMGIGPLIFLICATGLAGWAACAWRSAKWSARVARGAWVVVFLLPILWLVIPFTTLLDYSSIESRLYEANKQQAEAVAQAELAQSQAQQAQAQFQQNPWGQPVQTPTPTIGQVDEEKVRTQAREATDEQIKAIRDTVSLSVAFGVLILLGPKVIGLFPGIVRSCLTLKTLLPQSSAPGWIAIVVAPFYALFFALILSAAIQSDYSWMLSVALGFLTLAPLVVLLRWGAVAEPQTPDRAHRVVRAIRLAMGPLTGIGIAFLVVLLIDKISEELITVSDAISFVCAIGGNLLLVQVVVSDLMVSLIGRAHREGQAFASSELADRLHGRFVGLGLAEPAADGSTPSPAEARPA
ncbi:MAG: hypothetical protein AAF288_01590 [Planctomycetota bacterium]